MPQFLAYHVVVHALEGHCGWTPMAQFASSVVHVNNGHLPYARHHAAGWRRAREGASEQQIAQTVREFLQTDLTPGVRMIGSLSSPALVLEAFNEYNASSGVAVRTNVSMKQGGAHAPDVIAQRQSRVDVSDPFLCRVGTLALLEEMLSSARRNAHTGVGGPCLRVSGLASELGVSRSAAGEVAMVFETDGAIAVSELARKLGCHPRTLERKLRSEGLTAEAIRAAVRIVRSSDRLASEASLTTIAIEEGFSDLSHMTRSFKQSAGMQPSLLRRLLHADRAAHIVRADTHVR